ncbi:MAG: hypothetical protein AAGD01_09020 [Acidobacteriota bacterium]
MRHLFRTSSPPPRSLPAAARDASASWASRSRGLASRCLVLAITLVFVGALFAPPSATAHHRWKKKQKEAVPETQSEAQSEAQAEAQLEARSENQAKKQPEVQATPDGSLQNVVQQEGAPQDVALQDGALQDGVPQADIQVDTQTDLQVFQQAPLESTSTPTTEIRMFGETLDEIHHQTLASAHPEGRLRIAAACAALGYAPPPPPGTPEAKRAASQAHRLVAQRTYAEALKLQQAAANNGQKETQQEQLTQAATLYRETLTHAPGSASTLHNLGQVLEAQGELQSAEVALRCAAAFADPKERGAFLHRQGEFLQRHKRSAASTFGAASLALPGSRSAHRQAVSAFFTEGDQGGLLDHLWRLIEAGRGGQAQSIAFRLLLNQAPLESAPGASKALGANLPKLTLRTPQRSELLAIATAALGSRPLSPSRMQKTAIVQEQLPQLAEDSTLGDAASDLLSVLTETPDEYAERSFSWWRRYELQEWEDDRGLPAAEAFRQFMVSVGSWYESRDNDGNAAVCYKIATDLSPEDPDPRSLDHLVQVYARQNDQQSLREVASRYDFALFQGKGEAYASGDQQRIFEFHSTLGNLYLHLSESDPTYLGDAQRPAIATALFQLQRAYDTAKDLDLKAPRPPLHFATHGIVNYQENDQQRLTPELAAATAEAYQRAGDQDQAQFIAFDATRTLAAVGDDDGARRLAEEIPVSRDLLDDITIEERERYILRSPEILGVEGDQFALPDLEVLEGLEEPTPVA